ncbi:hypothetical protein NUV28_15430 [Burkholderia cenocepacia]|nr:hypothetical protein [Burkholderia cenocepacia]MDS0804223.1 hypothetical protein [Burkholderia cenocepacia]
MPMLQVASSAGITRLNICVSSPSSAQPAKQPRNVRRSVVESSRIQVNGGLLVSSPCVA